jgi:hypothetical protein
VAIQSERDIFGSPVIGGLSRYLDGGSGGCQTPAPPGRGISR